MNRIATEAEQDEAARIGAQVVELVDGWVARYATHALTDEERSQELGQAILNAVLMAGNDIPWLNRVHLWQGLGVSLGELFGCFPGMEAGLTHRFNAGIKTGRADMISLLITRGQA